MEWLVLLEDTVSKLLLDDSLRVKLSETFPFALQQEFVIKGNSSYAGRLSPLGSDAALLLLWRHGESSRIDVGNGGILSIWSNEGESTVWTIAEENRDEVVQRLCQLATRLWHRQEFPAHWDYKKVEGLPSIFAGDWRLRNLRLAYSGREVAGRPVIDIGSLFYARRSQKNIGVPLISAATLEGAVGSVEAPSIAEELQSGLPTGEGRYEGAPVVVLTRPEGGSRHLFSLPYSDWVADSGPLTRQQRRVIAHRVHRPLRVHGPAGSGKTLVLILKAQHLLREAQEQGQKCHVLLTVNRNALRQTVRTAIEVMDDHAFLASARDDLQYLDVNTLHGWCIKELGLEQGPQYVYDVDPELSKAEQDRILTGVLEELIPDALKGMRSTLSQDLLARLEGNREQLLRDIRYEIAVRIKGKGFRSTDRDSYVDSSTRSFIGRSENKLDRHFLFHIFSRYQNQFEREGLLDTDDVVLSMSARLGAPLWNVQRHVLGYDYVLVDEAHLFNDNEKRVLPYLTRGTTEFPALVMTFDEAQSIGGQRTTGLAEVGIRESEKQVLSSVHRSSPDILNLARDLVESSTLSTSVFYASESSATMTERELDRCSKPSLLFADGDPGIVGRVAETCGELRSENYPRVGVIVFDGSLLRPILHRFRELGIDVREVKERGEALSAIPKPGVFLMTPETCGGLEFDAVILAGADDGRVPRSIPGLSAEGYLSLQEDSYLELYTAVTRAKYRLVFICDSRRGPSSLLRHLISGDLLNVEGGGHR